MIKIGLNPFLECDISFLLTLTISYFFINIVLQLLHFVAIENFPCL